MALEHPCLQHHLLAVADLDAGPLEREQERRLDDVDPERHAGHALGLEDIADLLRGPPEQAGLGRDGAAHADHAGQRLLGGNLRGVEPVVSRGRAEVPHPGLAGARQQAPAGELVARPLADDRAREIADVVLIEREHRAQARGGQRLPGAAETVGVQAAEVHPLLEVHLHVAGRLQRPVPAVPRVHVVGGDGVGDWFLLACHRGLLAGPRYSTAARGCAPIPVGSPWAEPGARLRPRPRASTDRRSTEAARRPRRLAVRRRRA